MAAIVRVRDDNGNVFDIPALVGPKGDKGDPGKDAVGTPGKDGTPGKSAYQYALDGGYTGTEEEFARKLASESSFIHIGSEPPKDENVNVWIDTDEEPAESGGAQADWNANEGDPGHVLNRTHYKELVELLHETTADYDENDSVFVFDSELTFVEGETYIVNWNGVEYPCVAWTVSQEGMSIVAIGTKMFFGGDHTGEPFAFANMGGLVAAPVEEMAQVTASIKGVKYHKIPAAYLPTSVHWIDAVKVDGALQGITVTPAQTKEAINAGMDIKLRITESDESIGVISSILTLEETIAPSVYGMPTHMSFKNSEKSVLLTANFSSGSDDINEIRNMPWVVSNS